MYLFAINTSSEVDYKIVKLFVFKERLINQVIVKQQNKAEIKTQGKSFSLCFYFIIICKNIP